MSQVARPNWSPWPFHTKDEELPPQGRDRGDADHKAFYEAVKAIDAGDAEALQKLLAEYPELATARGYFDKYYEYPYFRGATLLHHLAGEPQRVPLPENAVELATALALSRCRPQRRDAGFGRRAGLGGKQCPTRLG